MTEFKATHLSKINHDAFRINEFGHLRRDVPIPNKISSLNSSAFVLLVVALPLPVL